MQNLSLVAQMGMFIPVFVFALYVCIEGLRIIRSLKEEVFPAKFKDSHYTDKTYKKK